MVELLVVIAVIALLASVLLPSLNSAREAAKGSACVQNQRTIGAAMLQYCAANRWKYPSAYYYVNGATSADGYVQWSGLLEEGNYMGGKDAFVCPSHKVKGWAPTNFTDKRIPDPPAGQVTQTAGLDDRQTKRITYVPNEALLGRKKYATMPVRIVGSDEVLAPAATILAAEYTDVASCLLDSSPTGGDAFKTHRPTNGVKFADTGDLYDGEKYGTATGTGAMALTPAEAETAIANAIAASALGNHHVCYVNPKAHRGVSNYLFADGHAASYTLSETLDPNEYLWGRIMYSAPDAPRVFRSGKTAADPYAYVNDGTDSQNVE